MRRLWTIQGPHARCRFFSDSEAKIEKGGGNVALPKSVGKIVAKRAIDKGIQGRALRSRRVSLSRPG
jgi:ribosomal protein L18